MHVLVAENPVREVSWKNNLALTMGIMLVEGTP